jgi:glycolate oxidase
MIYKKVTSEIIGELIEILGAKNVIYNNFEAMEQYSHDEVAEKSYAHMPEVVVKPSTTKEISKTMKLANKYKIPVTPRGAGSGLSGGAIPVNGGIVLSLEKMNKILEIYKKNLIAVVEPGVVTNDINKLVKDDGLFYAGYPMSVETCYIGGNVAENAGGGKAVKYGVTGRYICGLEVVTPTGEIMHLGGKRMKDVTGYDLMHLMVGSEGTLGIFTKIYIKLIPLPKANVSLLVLFKDIESAIKLVPKIMTFGRIIPTSIEFMDELSFKTSCEYLNEKIPFKKAGAMLLIELDGNSKKELEEQYEIIGNLCMQNGAIEVYVAIKELSEKYDIPIPCYGHAGDGNLHPTPIKNPKFQMDEWYEKLDTLLLELYKAAIELGGTISGEHGIGSKRNKYISMALEPAQIEMMKKIKKALDPNLVLNPEKIF